MDVTAKLLRVFQVEKQLRGLQSKLNSAEKFLAEQNKELQGLTSRRATLDAQAKLLAAQAALAEGEVKRLDERMATVRKQMDSAQTNKEYQAFLVELNNYKVDRDKAETQALEMMGKLEELKKQSQEVEGRQSERDKVRGVAATERDAHYREIEARLLELKGQRDAAAAEVPQDSLALLTRLLNQRGEDAMAPVHVQDRKRHEFTCGACQMSIPVDAVSVLLTKGKVTLCASCQCILFLDEDAVKAMQPPSKRAEAAGPRGSAKRASKSSPSA